MQPDGSRFARVMPVTGDAHEGLVDALGATSAQGVLAEVCTHFVRNLLARAPKRRFSRRWPAWSLDLRAARRAFST